MGDQESYIFGWLVFIALLKTKMYNNAYLYQGICLAMYATYAVKNMQISSGNIVKVLYEKLDRRL